MLIWGNIIVINVRYIGATLLFSVYVTSGDIIVINTCETIVGDACYKDSKHTRARTQHYSVSTFAGKCLVSHSAETLSANQAHRHTTHITEIVSL